METVLTAIVLERARQERLWGGKHSWGSGSCADPSLPDPVKLLVLTEETGEVARAVLERQPEELRKELVQVAAVAVAWLESLSEKAGSTHE